MNKKSTKTKARRLIIKKTVNFKICLITCIIALVVMLGFDIFNFIDCHIDNSFSLRSDITNYHELYYETKDLRTLQELEDYLQLNQMPYTIKNNKLSTDLFDFDVTDTNNINQLIKSDFVEIFNNIDDKSENTKVAVDFKDGKMIEKVSYNNIEKENMTYYQDFHSYLKSSILMIITLAIVFFIVLLLFGTKITFCKKNKQENDLNKEEHS